MNKNFVRNKKGLTPILTVLAVLALLMVGGAVLYSAIKSSQNQEKLINVLASQKAQPTQQLSVAGQPISTITETTGLSTPEACALKAGYQKGDTVSTSITVFDKESTTQGTITPGIQVMKKENGKYSRVYSMTSFSSAQTLARPAAGDTVSFYGGNTSTSPLLVDPKLDFCLDSRTPTINLDGHTTATAGSVSVKVFDPLNNNNVLSAGYNLSQEDYVLSITSDDKKDVVIQVYNNGSNKLLPLKAFTFGRVGNITGVVYNPSNAPGGGIYDASFNVKAYIASKGAGYDFQSVGCARNISNSPIALDLSKAGTQVSTGTWTNCYSLPGTDYLPLKQGDWVKFNFQLQSGSGDPVDNNVSSTKNLAAFMFLDGGWAEDTNNEPVFDYYTHNTNADSNAGLIENTTAPYGNNVGTSIEGI